LCQNILFSNLVSSFVSWQGLWFITLSSHIGRGSSSLFSRFLKDVWVFNVHHSVFFYSLWTVRWHSNTICSECRYGRW
jgi:hypothetical protein